MALLATGDTEGTKYYGRARAALADAGISE